MKVIANFCIIPMGVEASVARYIAEVEKILTASGMTYEMHAHGTNIEGELRDITSLIEKCYDALYAMGVPRLYTTLHFAARQDKEQHMADKLESLKEFLE